MKKFFLIFLFLGVSLNGTMTSSVRAQAIVNDPLHMASNLASFIAGLSEAVTTTSKIVQQIAFADSMAKMAKKGIDFLNKVDKEIQTIAGIAELTKSFYNTTLAMERTMEQVKRGGKLTIPEWTQVLSDYTNYLNTATGTVRSITNLLKDEHIVASYYERQKMIAENKAALEETTKKMLYDLYKARTKSEHRASIDALFSTPDLPAIPLITVRTNCLDPEQMEMSWGAAAMDAIARIEKHFGADERQTELQAKNMLKKQFEPYANIFYGISGIIGIIAAVRIYSKVNLGEPMDKLIVMFVGAVILLFLLPSFINMIFF